MASRFARYVVLVYFEYSEIPLINPCQDEQEARDFITRFTSARQSALYDMEEKRLMMHLGSGSLHVSFEEIELELIKEAVPGLSRVAYLWNSANPTATHFFKETERASSRVAIQLHPM